MDEILIGLFVLAGLTGLFFGWRWLERNVTWVAQRAENWRQRIVRHYPSVRGFVAARFARGEYLGLHLTVGFLVSLLGLVAFSIITHNVVQKRAITQLDVRVTDFLHSHGTLFGYGFWAVISSLGAGLTIAIVGVGVAVLLSVRKRWVVLAGWMAAILGAGALDGALKIAIRRPRPEVAMDFLNKLSWSFPSGHSMSSLVTYGMLAYLITLTIKGRLKLQISVMLAALLLILSIGFSRLYLGVHYFSDVLGGFTAGALWLSACISGLEVARRLKARGAAPVAP